MRPEGKKRVFSGVQPTGRLHLGNYLGAISHWVAHQDDYDNLFCIVDLHALTLPETVVPARLRQKTREVAALYLACGIDPGRSTVFVQSHVPEHPELAWLLTCITPLGWLQRMTQFKSKAGGAERVGAGLLCYPALMAADILLYDTDLVPVGEDQRQHIEIARDVALRFNHLFGITFRIPEPVIRESGARVMSLDNPEAKMSKSAAELVRGHAVGLLDPPDEIRRTVMRATTDSGSETRFAFASPGVRNLLVIYEALSGLGRLDVEAEFAGVGYGRLKGRVADLVIETLRPIRERFREISADPAVLDDVLAAGAAKAESLARPMMERVRKAVGFVPRPGSQ